MNANRLDFTYFDCTHADPGVDCAISVAAENTGQSQTTNRIYKRPFLPGQKSTKELAGVNYSFHQGHSALLNTKTSSHISGQEGLA